MFTNHILLSMKCECVVTDGAIAMTGQGIGFAGILKNHGVNCPMFHWIIHQEALCAKSLQISKRSPKKKQKVFKIFFQAISNSLAYPEFLIGGGLKIA